MILVDTSIWGQHLKRSNSSLSKLLEADRVLTHPFVIGELSLAVHPLRTKLLQRLSTLDALPVATSEEVMQFISRQRLAGTGVGWVDAHLLFSAAAARASLWTSDRALQKQAERLRVPSQHT